ncbi:hypothetical protein GOBAR_AA15130 [Gossypium barbadense]|uniref:Uncharacterized protein n=1 Tax=Gossypium barbadense TaxID=3634 RepID=A0A2P5XQ97_GOSBA|nr:hypothetical protein GOBAR_AA15130 [Gossypium barbadense]
MCSILCLVVSEGLGDHPFSTGKVKRASVDLVKELSKEKENVLSWHRVDGSLLVAGSKDSKVRAFSSLGK